MELADWLKVFALIAIGFVAFNKGDRIVAAIDDLRAELSRQGTSLTQVGTDLAELLERIAANQAAGDPTADDVAAAAAIADGLVALGGQVDAILAEEDPGS